MIELLRAMGLDDISAAIWGFLAGATLVALWISAWFVGESVLDRLAPSGFDADVDVDQAVTVGNNTAVAEQAERAERFHNWGVTR